MFRYSELRQYLFKSLDQYIDLHDLHLKDLPPFFGKLVPSPGLRLLIVTPFKSDLDFFSKTNSSIFLPCLNTWESGDAGKFKAQSSRRKGGRDLLLTNIHVRNSSYFNTGSCTIISAP